jgi:hypothetical protein
MSFHDEPMVVENGPLGIDVGATHAGRPAIFFQPTGTNNWERQFSQFNKIVLICKKNNNTPSEAIETRITNLSRGLTQPITITLDGNNAEKVKLSWSGDGHDVLTIEPQGGPSGGFQLNRNGMARRLTHASLKVSVVEWFESEGQTTASRFPSSGVSNHDSIFIGLYA